MTAGRCILQLNFVLQLNFIPDCKDCAIGMPIAEHDACCKAYVCMAESIPAGVEQWIGTPLSTGLC